MTNTIKERTAKQVFSTVIILLAGNQSVDMTVELEQESEAVHRLTVSIPQSILRGP